MAVHLQTPSSAGGYWLTRSSISGGNATLSVSAINGGGCCVATAATRESAIAGFLTADRRSRKRGFAAQDRMDRARVCPDEPCHGASGESGKDSSPARNLRKWIDRVSGTKSFAHRVSRLSWARKQGGCPVAVRAEGATRIAHAPSTPPPQERRWERCEGLRTRKTMGYCDFEDGYSRGHCVRTLDDFIERSTSA
jgi:hypothetical protein